MKILLNVLFNSFTLGLDRNRGRAQKLGSGGGS